MSETPQTFGRPFQAGEAWRGNAHGRPRIGESFAELVRQAGGGDGKLYLDKIVALALGEHRDAKVRFAALTWLVERGWGKSVEHLNVSGSLAPLDPSRLSRLSDAELEAAAAIVAKLTTNDRGVM